MAGHIRRLFFDIETSPNVGFFWRPGYNVRLTYDNIIHERKIICAAWKWQGTARVHCADWGKKQDDRPILEALLPALAEADEIVAHFGDGFDVPWTRARALILGWQALPQYKTVDTCAWAKRLFDFNSNKLDYLGQALGIGRKIHTEYGLWKDVVLKNCNQSLMRMTRYCSRDVTLLEKVWARLAMVAQPKSHAGVIGGREKWSCPRCASETVYIRQSCTSAAGTRTAKMQCRKCGGFFRINDTARKRYEEAKAEKARSITSIGRPTRPR